MPFIRSLLCLALLLCANVAQADDFPNCLTDQAGGAFNLDNRKEPIVVIVFLGVDCPLAKLYTPRLQEMHNHWESRGVLVLGVDSNDSDTQAQVAEFAHQHDVTFPLLKDERHRLADRLGATRTPEVVVLDELRKVRYRGAIDDQYSPGTNRTRATQSFVELAVNDLLAGRSVQIASTKATGCFIDKSDTVKSSVETEPVTYAEQVAPILQRRCMECHRPGQVGPFSLVSYADAVSHADTIREVVNDKRMPPWSADSRYGHFANDRSLTTDELRTLNLWLDGGRAEGDSSKQPSPPKFSGQWTSQPDIVVAMPQPFAIPATGIVEYQDFIIDPGFTQDVWAQAIEVLPGNRSVVHHVNVYIQPPRDPGVEESELQDELLAIFVPGSSVTSYPVGLAKRIPAHWRLKLNVHYVTVGSPQSDQTRVGFQLAHEVSKQVATHMMLNEHFEIPPHSPDTEVSDEWKINHDLQLIAMHPHMHLRGRSMRFEATFPDGRTEILLNVPKYDFMWQHRYVLSELKSLPAGTVLRCVGHFDNSAANPNNPDPAAIVRPGKLTSDEMFQGNWEVCLADQDLEASTAARWWRRCVALGTLVVGLGLLIFRRPKSPGLVVERELCRVE